MLKIILFLVVCFLPFSALANTMTFAGTSHTCHPNCEYSEDGITADYAKWLTYPGTAQMAAGGISGPSRMNFTMDGRFDAISFDFAGFFDSFFYDANFNEVIIPYGNFNLKGFRNGNLIATSGFQSRGGPVLLDDTFRDLDRFTISLLYPPGSILGYGHVYCWLDCFSGFLDNVVLAPVVFSSIPLPASLPLYAAGLILGGLFFKRRRFHRAVNSRI